MTKAYGLNPPLSNPLDIESLPVDFRNTKGSSKCCQFFNDALPPSWYFFYKETNTYLDNRFGINKPPYGSWKSGLNRLVVTELQNPSDLLPGFEVLKNDSATITILYEKTLTDLKVIGTSTPRYGSPPNQSIPGVGTRPTPSFIGQIYIDTFGAVWMAIDIASKTWYPVSMGTAGS